MAVKHNPRVIKALTERGYHADSVDRYDSFSGRTHDLFGIIDVLGVGNGETIAVQVTSRGNMASRRRKIADSDVIDKLRDADWRIELWGYDQPNGPRTKYRLKVEDLS